MSHFSGLMHGCMALKREPGTHCSCMPVPPRISECELTTAKSALLH